MASLRRWLHRLNPHPHVKYRHSLRALANVSHFNIGTRTLLYRGSLVYKPSLHPSILSIKSPTTSNSNHFLQINHHVATRTRIFHWYVRPLLSTTRSDIIVSSSIDKAGAALKPDSQKTTTESMGDSLKGTGDSIASTLQPQVCHNPSAFLIHTDIRLERQDWHPEDWRLCQRQLQRERCQSPSSNLDDLTY